VGFPTPRSSAFFLLLLIIIVLALNSCNHSTLPEPFIEEGSYGIVQLKVGNIWEYNWEKFSRDSIIINERKLRYVVTERSFDPKKKIVEPVYGVSTVYFYNNEWGLPSLSVYFYRNYNDGLYIMGGKEPANIGYPPDTLYTKILRLKYPVSKGDKWRGPGKTEMSFSFPLYEPFLLTDTTTFTCLNIDAKIETPLGIFSCIVYFRSYIPQDDVNQILDIYEYYSANVGLVAIITKQRKHQDLKSYPYSQQMLITTNFINNKN
jgi:hypothetical protein